MTADAITGGDTAPASAVPKFDWGTAVGDALALGAGDKPIRFTFTWRGRRFQGRLAASGQAMQMTLAVLTQEIRELKRHQDKNTEKSV